jgi:hypothetical protein
MKPHGKDCCRTRRAEQFVLDRTPACVSVVLFLEAGRDPDDADVRPPDTAEHEDLA